MRYILLLCVVALLSSCSVVDKIKQKRDERILQRIDTTYRADLPPPPSPHDSDYVALPEDPRMVNEVENELRNLRQRSTIVIDTIPVMFTVVYSLSNPANNIPDGQIYSQIAATNRHLEVNNIPMRVKLAVRDPAGNPSTGIVRVTADHIPNFTQDGVQRSSQVGAVELAVKNLNRWDVTKVLNTWIVPEINGNNGGSGIQGWAYFPMSPLFDGIMIQHTAFGATDVNEDDIKDVFIPGQTTRSNLSMGKIWTHELGHVFELYHAFQGGSCNPEANCLLNGDRVCDTKPRPQGSGCTIPICTGPPGTPPVDYVYIDNIMDYGSQRCLDIFTQGQAARMVACLNLKRPGYRNSPFLSAPVAMDASLTLSYNGYTCSGTVPVTATITNLGLISITLVQINNVIYPVNIPKGGKADIKLTDILLTMPGPFEKIYTLEKVNGQPDSNPANNSALLKTERIQGANLRMEITLDYFGAENSWTVTDESGNVVWVSPAYPNYKNKLVVKSENCLPPGNYTLTMKDTRGDAQYMNTPVTAGAGFKFYVGNTVTIASQSCWCTNSHSSCKNCYEMKYIFRVD